MTWETDILNGISAPTSQNNINKMDAWAACERPGIQSNNNPFNTTLDYGGGVTVNSAGVKRYPSLAVGIQATIRTLLYSNPAYGYSRIVNNLRNDGPQSTFASAVGSTPWGTSGTCIANTVQPGATGSTTPQSQVQPYTPSSGQVTFTYAQLEGLWINGGGSKQTAAMAAAIAMAESGGNSQASNTNSNGSIDRGLWQINSTNGAGSSFDIMTNVRTAITMSNNGTNWRPWCTAYSDGACGTAGGCYLCSGAPYQKYLNSSVAPDMSVSPNSTASVTPQTTPSSPGASAVGAPNLAINWGQIVGQAAACSFQPLLCLANDANIANPVNAWIANAIGGTVVAVLNPFIQLIAGGLGLLGGGVLMLGGFYMMIEASQAGQQGTGAAKRAVGSAAMLLAPEAAPAVYESERGTTTVQRTRARRIGGVTVRPSRTTTTRQRNPQTITYYNQGRLNQRTGQRGPATVTQMQYQYGPGGAQINTTRNQLRGQAYMYNQPAQGPSFT